MPRNAPLAGSISSANSPTSFARAISLLELDSRLRDLAEGDLGVDQPEAAREKGALLAFQSVDTVVAKEIFAARKALFHHIDRVGENVVVERKAQHRRKQYRSVHAPVESLAQEPALRVHALSENRLADLLGFRRPALRIRQEAGGAVERHPAHELAVHVVPRGTAHLPEPLIGLVPMARDERGERGEQSPVPFAKLARELVVDEREVEDLAVDIDLPLGVRAIAGPYRAASRVAIEMPERLLVDFNLAANAVHDLNVRQGLAAAVDEKFMKSSGLAGIAKGRKRVQRESGVTQPAEAIVPVPFAADVLRQRRGQCGDDRAGRREGHHFQRERAAADELGIASSIAAVADPFGPECVGSCEKFVDARRGRSLCLGVCGQHEIPGRAGRDREGGRRGVALDRAFGCAEQRGNAVAADGAVLEPQDRPGPCIVHGRPVDELELHRTAQSGQAAHHPSWRVERHVVVCACVEAASHGHEIGQRDLAIGSGEHRAQNIGVG